MSLKSKVSAVCQKCGATEMVTIYKSINVAENPQLKAKVLSGELFLWECPHCSAGNLLGYDCLYHDPNEKIMVWMLPSGVPEGFQKEAIVKQAGAMGDYRLRIVGSAGELIEKVMIFDAGLSDRCMELVKYVALKEMPGVDNLHFYRMQDDVMVFSGVKEGRMDGIGIGLNVYEDCSGIIARNPSLGEEDGFVSIDASWVSSVIG